MRRFMALLLIGCLILSMSACNKGSVDIGKEEEEGTQNLIPGGYFEQQDPKWGTYTESAGKGTIAVNAAGQLEVSIEKTGRVAHAVQVYCDGFELLQNAVYEISFDISSTVERTMEWRIQLNGGDYHPYFSEEKVAITKEMQHFNYTVIMKEPSDPAPRFCFNLGFQEADGELAAHTVTIDNVELILKDASQVKASVKENMEPSILINQVGYRPQDTKTAIFRDSSLDNKFDVVNIETGKIVYSGDVAGAVPTKSAGETIAYGDFSAVKEPGNYKLAAANSGESYPFVIAEEVYEDIFADTVKMIYLQRCGSELSSKYAGDFAHAACHTGNATIYGTTQTKDVSGGWHDAGDYGRYVVSGAKAVADLLLAYEDYGQVFDDMAGIPESGNGIPDILDEARYELEWLLKMQDETTGGVYHKVTGLYFEDMVMPERVTAKLYILPISNCATGDFAAVMAMAARLYKPFDAAFAKECLASAESALRYLEENDQKDGFRNPDNVVTGEYPDAEDNDEYFWALSELYKTTGSSYYDNKLTAMDIISLEEGMGWQAVGLYGCYAYLTAEQQDADLQKKLINKFGDYLNTIESNIETDGYFSSIGDVYPWGSNMSIANHGSLFLMAKKLLSRETDYNQLAKKQADYLLGANATSYCFVTGYGTLSPKNTHHRPSEALGTTMAGMLVGGANSNLEDPYAQSVLAGKPAAKCYVDHVQSYSCNEVTVYWNSPLIYLLAGLLAD